MLFGIPNRLRKINLFPKHVFFLTFILAVVLFYAPAILHLEFFNLPTQAEANSKKNMTSAWPHQESDLEPDPEFEFGQLSNGFRYVMMKNTHPKGRVSMHLNVKVGSLNEGDEERGLAHFLEHMQFNGSKNFKPGELVKYFQRIGMQFGPDANAHTSFSETVYDILLPKGDAQSISDGMVVMRDYADGALLLPSEIDKERRVVLAEMRTRDSASYRTLEASLKFEFPEALLSRRLPIGTKEALRNADRELIDGFYRAWYRPDNMFLIMVGDFDPKAVHKAVKEHFGDMSSNVPMRDKPDFGRIQHDGISSFYHYEKEAGNTTVAIGNLIELEPQPDSFALQKNLMIRNIADQIVQNRIDAILSKENTPFTSAEIGSGQFLSRVQYAQISAETKPSGWDKTLIQLEKILRTALIYGFQPAELERVKNDFQSKLDNEVKKAATRDSKKIANQVIRHLNSNRVLQSPEQEKKIYGPVLKEATVEDVNRAFRSVWSANHRLLSVTGDAHIEKGSQTPEEKIISAYELSLKSAVKSPPKVHRASFPYLPEPQEKGKIVSRKNIADLGIEQIDFANGLRMNLKKTDFRKNQVRINVAFGNGQSAEPRGLAGISELTEAVISESGVGRLTADELKAALSGKESQVSLNVQEENFLITGYTVPDELQLLFQLIHTYLVDPGFRESAYRLSLERFRQRDGAMSQSVDGVMSLSGERFLAGGDGRFGTASFKELKRISLEQIKEWVETEFKSTSLEVSIVGDFDPEEAIGAVATYLATLPLKDHSYKSNRSNKIIFPTNKTAVFKVDSKIPKSLVVVAYPTTDFWDINRTRRLSALADLFSERLRVYIREELGAAYSPFAYNHAFYAYPGFGMLRAHISTDPKMADSVAEAVKELAQQITDSPISPDELKRIKDPIVQSIKDLRRTNRYWLNSVLTLSSRYPQKLEWSRTIESDYGAITAEELLTLAKKYFTKDTAATVIVIPEEVSSPQD